jgi:hypothetical protein
MQRGDIEALRMTFPASDLPILASAYDVLPTWPQRAQLVLLTHDAYENPALHPMYRRVLRDAIDARIESSTGEALALSAAVCALDPSDPKNDAGRYFDDAPAALARARQLS